MMATEASIANRDRGFTLIELLVAISLLAIIAILAWKGLDQTLRGRSQISASMDQERAVQLAFEQLRQDLAAAAVATPMSAAVVQVQGDSLAIMRWTQPADGAAELWRVEYRIRQGLLWRQAQRIDAPRDGGNPSNRLSSSHHWLDQVTAINAHLYIPGHGWSGTSLPAGAAANQVAMLKLEVWRQHWTYPVVRIYRIGE